jgi:putative lipoprotein (rSAM/lipoprotein system)
MKINRRGFLKKMNAVLASLIGMLGFANCHKVEYGPEMYGSPHADYTIKGAVTDKLTGKPLAGIRVRYIDRFADFMYGPPQTDFSPMPSVLTDEKGEYKLTGDFFPIKNDEKLPVYYAEDTEYEEHLYNAQYIEVSFKDAEQVKKSNGWYDGEYLVNQDIELSERIPETNDDEEDIKEN